MQTVVMYLRALLSDPVSEVPVVVLQAEDGEHFLPIWIGQAEANAIAIAVDGDPPPRPMTHDLLLTSMDVCGWQLHRVLIHSMAEHIFFADLFFRRREGGGEELVLDARPSDGIALALRCGAVIEATEDLVERAGTVLGSRDEAMRLILERLTIGDAGGYEM